MSRLQRRYEGAFDFADPWSVWAARDPLLTDLSATRAFRRLNHVRFLGAIDYLLVPGPNGARGNIRHTRFEHSMGVARLALLHADLRRLRGSERQVRIAAALLHDIGHAPLSHSLEPVFREVFGIEHHLATADVISGRVPIGRGVYKALLQHGVDVDRVLAIVSGDEKVELFSGPINLDTIEGILRSQTYVRPGPGVPSPERVVRAATKRIRESDVDDVDEFWRYKDFVYRHIINSTAGVLADHLCQQFMRRTIASFSRDDYFLTEPQMFKRLPGLREILTSRSFIEEACEHLEFPITHPVRRFFINPSANFLARDDAERYLQKRESRRLGRVRAKIESSEGIGRDLFA